MTKENVFGNPLENIPGSPKVPTPEFINKKDPPKEKTIYADRARRVAMEDRTQNSPQPEHSTRSASNREKQTEPISFRKKAGLVMASLVLASGVGAVAGNTETTITDAEPITMTDVDGNGVVDNFEAGTSIKEAVKKVDPDSQGFADSASRQEVISKVEDMSSPTAVATETTIFGHPVSHGNDIIEASEIPPQEDIS